MLNIVQMDKKWKLVNENESIVFHGKIFVILKQISSLLNEMVASVFF